MSRSLGADDLQTAVPNLTGTITLSGLERPVEVYRDRFGIPHIRAGSVHDAFFAQGFVHAQDRLWFMDYDRRRAYGRTAEFLGAASLEMDILMRRLQLGVSAQADYAALAVPTRTILDAYAAGVNAFIAQTSVLPIEYRLLSTSPEPWQPWDACAIYKGRHVLMGVGGNKLWRMQQLRTGGVELLQRLRTGATVPTPLVVSPDIDVNVVPEPTDLSLALAEAVAGLGELESGSNNWVIHGSRTTTGLPLLAGDPHRGLEVPNVYYQNHLACPEFDVIGYSFAGVPAFPHFGHNAQVAWCITHAGADYQDLFVERFAPGDPSRYEWQGEWHVASQKLETIAVQGADEVEISVTSTHHGSIVAGNPADGYALALRYTATAKPNATFDCLLPMLLVKSVDELDAAMQHWVDPCNNFLMADVHGNVSYLLRGELPVRSLANAWLPVPGWTGEHEWLGQVPFEELPRLHNPTTGFIITANNRIVGDDYPHYVSLDWAAPYRAQRLRHRLQTLSAARGEDMIALHGDKVSLPGQMFVEQLNRVATTNKQTSEAKARLLNWDGTMNPDDVAPTIYAVWREQTIALVLSNPALAPLTAPLVEDKLLALPLAARLRQPLLAMMQADDPTLLPPGETWSTLLTKALERATTWLTQEFGSEQATWQWQRLHRVAPQHPLATIFPDLAPMLNPPSTGVGGDGDTPQAASFGGGESGYTVRSSSVARYVFDLADWDCSAWIVPLGTSGHPGSSHYADQLTLWSTQQLCPMYYNWETVMKEAQTQQQLVQAGTNQ